MHRGFSGLVRSNVENSYHLLYYKVLHHFEQEFSMVKYLVIFLYGREKEPLLKGILYDPENVAIQSRLLYILLRKATVIKWAFEIKWA